MSQRRLAVAVLRDASCRHCRLPLSPPLPPGSRAAERHLMPFAATAAAAVRHAAMPMPDAVQKRCHFTRVAAAAAAAMPPAAARFRRYAAFLPITAYAGFSLPDFAYAAGRRSGAARKACCWRRAARDAARAPRCAAPCRSTQRRKLRRGGAYARRSATAGGS